jgi:hypothetical protein
MLWAEFIIVEDLLTAVSYTFPVMLLWAKNQQRISFWYNKPFNIDLQTSAGLTDNRPTDIIWADIPQTCKCHLCLLITNGRLNSSQFPIFIVSFVRCPGRTPRQILISCSQLCEDCVRPLSLQEVEIRASLCPVPNFSPGQPLTTINVSFRFVGGAPLQPDWRLPGHQHVVQGTTQWMDIEILLLTVLPFWPVYKLKF